MIFLDFLDSSFMCLLFILPRHGFYDPVALNGERVSCMRLPSLPVLPPSKQVRAAAAAAATKTTLSYIDVYSFYSWHHGSGHKALSIGGGGGASSCY